MKKEVKIRKGNVVLRVSEEEVDRYIQNGYGIVGADGKVIDQKASEESQLLEKLLESQKTVVALRKELEAVKATKNEAISSDVEVEMGTLREQISDLKDELRETKKQLKTAEKRLHKYED